MLSVVIPVYNFAQGAAETVRRLRAWVVTRTDVCEIIFVDDGSTDDTVRALGALDAPFRVISLPHNVGKGGAVKAGVLEARGEYVFFTDADLPYDVQAFDAACSAFRAGADMVCGSRTVEGTTYVAQRSGKRRLSSAVFSWFANRILLKSVGDTQCGFKGFTKETARSLFSELRESRYVFDVELLYLAQHAGRHITFVPVTLVADSVSSIRLVRDSVSMLVGLARLYVRTRAVFTRKDFLLIGIIGVLIGLLSVPTLHNVGVLAILTGIGIPYLAIVLGLVILVPLGLLCGVLGLTLLPLHKRVAVQFSRYGAVGAFNLVLNAAIFNTLLYLTGITSGPWVTVFALCTFAIVISQAYFWHTFWTFDTSARVHDRTYYIRFFLVTTATALTNLAVIHVMVNVIGAPQGIPEALWANLALLVTIVTSVLGNFLGYKFIVFRQ